MMRIVMTQIVSGTRNGVEWPAVGERLTVPDDEADQLIATGLAVADPAGEVESASMTAKRIKGR
jgi:hypothetical protein